MTWSNDSVSSDLRRWCNSYMPLPLEPGSQHLHFGSHSFLQITRGKSFAFFCFIFLSWKFVNSCLSHGEGQMKVNMENSYVCGFKEWSWNTRDVQFQLAWEAHRKLQMYIPDVSERVSTALFHRLETRRANQDEESHYYRPSLCNTAHHDLSSFALCLTPLVSLFFPLLSSSGSFLQARKESHIHVASDFSRRSQLYYWWRTTDKNIIIFWGGTPKLPQSEVTLATRGTLKLKTYTDGKKILEIIQEPCSKTFFAASQLGSLERYLMCVLVLDGSADNTSLSLMGFSEH